MGAPLALSWEQAYKLIAAGSTANATFFAAGAGLVAELIALRKTYYKPDGSVMVS